MSCNWVRAVHREGRGARGWASIAASVWALGCGAGDAPCAPQEAAPCQDVVRMQFAASLSQAASYEVLIEGAGATVQCTIELDGAGKATSLVSCTEPAHWLQEAGNGAAARYVGVALAGEHKLLQVALKRGGGTVWTREVRPNYQPTDASCGACAEAVATLDEDAAR